MHEECIDLKKSKLAGTIAPIVKGKEKFMTSMNTNISSRGRFLSDYSESVDKFNELHSEEIHRVAIDLIRLFSGKGLADDELRMQIKEEVGKRIPGINSEEMAPLKRDIEKSIFCSI